MVPREQREIETTEGPDQVPRNIVRVQMGHMEYKPAKGLMDITTE